ncbi:MAG: trypsin-like serine protease [Promethearchaeota archaeon]
MKDKRVRVNPKRILLFILFLCIFTIPFWIDQTQINKMLNPNKKIDLNTNGIIGLDDRVRITPTTMSPWSSIVKFYTNWGGYDSYGTGAMIDKNHVLTVAHCVYSQSLGGWADSVKVVPGADNGYEPYGYAWAINIRTYDSWINYENPDHDFAVITLDRDIGLQTGWMEILTTIPEDPIYSDYLCTAGYPYDLDYGNNMYFCYDIGEIADEYTHWYNLDINEGQSGSPIWISNLTDYYIVSVAAYGYEDNICNYGVRINRNKYDCIDNWVTADDTLIDKPDLASRSNSLAGFTPSLGGSGITNFEVWCKVRNLGTLSSNDITVSYYASLDTIISVEDYLIGTDMISLLAPTMSTESRWSGVLPGDLPNGTYYVGWIIDINENIDEFNENNNINCFKDYQLKIDGTPPLNPTNCDQLNGTTRTDKWQSQVNNPLFSWSGHIDSQGEVEGYYCYWGSESYGESSYFTNLSIYDPSSVSSGTYYMRVRTKDTFGNIASWKTIYIFKYDGTAPENPTDCDQLAGTTESDVWQGDVDDPFFIWEEGIDNHTGVDGYYYYWGKNPIGISDSYTRTPIFNPPMINTGIYYLRVSTKDIVGNRAPWKTLYIFKYSEGLGIDPHDSISPNPINILVVIFLLIAFVSISFLIIIIKK